MEFRVAALTDPELRTLLDEYFAFRNANVVRDHGTYHVFYPEQSDFTPPHGEFIVACDDDAATLGCGGIKRIGDGIYEVKNVWTRPAARGRGVAGALVERLEQDARSWGAQVFRLDTNRSLTAALRLYRRLGYRAVPPYNDNPNATDWFEKPARPS